MTVTMGSFSLLHWVLFGCIAYFMWRVLVKKKAGANAHRKPSNEPAPEPDNPDHWEGAFWDVANPRPTDIPVHLLYKDGNGQRTKRTVKVTGFDALPNGLIIGTCLLRNATRTFRYDRVERAIDPETGEVIANLHGWLLDKYHQTPRGMAQKLSEDYTDLLKVLLYVAKADGSMRAAEIEVIAGLAAKIAGETRIDGDVVRKATGYLGTPTIQGFELAFGRVKAADPGIAAQVVGAARSIVGTQKTIHPTEQAALDYLEKALAKT